MSITELFFKVILPIGIDIVYAFYFFTSLPPTDEQTVEGFPLFWFRFLIIVLAIPLLYILKILDYFGLLHEQTLLHAKFFYWFLYFMILLLAIPELVEWIAQTVLR